MGSAGWSGLFCNQFSLSAAVPRPRTQGEGPMESSQVPLFVEDLNEAIRATINALGGMKAVGVELRPEKSAVDAGKWLADCLNPDKRDRLAPDQLAYIRRRGRIAGCHILASFEMQDAGYAPPVALEPEDERAALQREFVHAVKALEVIQQRIARAA